MKTRICLVVCVLVVVAGTAHASYLFDWTAGSPHQTSITDATGDTAPPNASGADITALMWARDDNYTYFRMDLLDGMPGTSLYGIYIHDDASGATGSSTFMPQELDGNGITSFVTAPRNSDYLWSPSDFVWNGGSSSFDQVSAPSGFAFNVTPYPTYNIPGTVTLEWRIENAQLPNNFTFWGATMGWDIEGQRHTVDLTQAAATPEPTTLALLGIGLGGVFLKRRRKA